MRTTQYQSTIGIGSLFSWSSQQWSQQKERVNENGSSYSVFPTTFKPISPNYPAKGIGIKREFEYCWRYAALTANYCAEEEDCDPIYGGVFEVPSEEEYTQLRYRESSYEILKVHDIEVEQPFNNAINESGSFFAWGGTPASRDCKNTTGENEYEALISQSYFDVILGGILSWDGQMANNKMYTWDLEAELVAIEAGNEDAFYSSVTKAPSLPFDQREKMCMVYLKTTKSALSYEWANDRSCPYSLNPIITPKDMLNYPETVEFVDGVVPNALGCASPLASKRIYDYIDEILTKSGWRAKNTIEERVDPCAKSGSLVSRTSNKWEPNPYYRTFVECRNNLISNSSIPKIEKRIMLK